MYARDHGQIATPIGMIRVEGDETTLLTVQIGADGPAFPGTGTAVRVALAQLAAYFVGTLTQFDVSLPAYGSQRGLELRDGLIAIGYGEAVTYGELARRFGSGPRAIGQLCARNPVPIIVPCHRVLSAGGKLGSYSAGAGPMTKQWLLDHERRHRGE